MSPRLAAVIAERLFFTAPRTSLNAKAQAFVRSGRSFRLRVEGRRVQGWSWGAGPAVYLAHGWGGRGGYFGAFAGPLIDAGFRVVTWDAPGHGASDRGMTSMPEFARALRAVVELHGRAHAVIAHSMGGSAAALAAAWDVSIDRLVFLGSPVDPAAFVGPFARALGLRPAVIAAMRARSERRLRYCWDDLDVRALGRRCDLPLLVVHDRDDDTVPFADGVAIAATWPRARLHETRGLGHRGVMRDPDVVGTVVRFVTAAETARAAVR